MDPLRNMGIALTSMGTAGLVASTVMIATGKQEMFPSPCPGCEPLIQNSFQQIAGAGLFGASLIGVLFGAPMWALGTVDEPLEQGERVSNGRFLAGVGLTVIGAASTAAGAFAGLADDHFRFGQLSGPFAILGTVSTMIGIPLWVSGAKRKPPQGGPPMVRRSRGVMAGGITITIIGAATIGAAAIVSSFGGHDETVRAFTGAMTFTSLGLVLAGIPMWYFGQENIVESPWSTSSATPRLHTHEAREAREAPKPEIQVGPTGVSMRFVF